MNGTVVPMLELGSGVDFDLTGRENVFLNGAILGYPEQFLKENIPEITIARPAATYLLWLDCRGLRLPGDELPKFMAEEAHLALNDGRGFGKTEGEGYMRMNIACPRSTVEKAMAQLKAAVDKLR